MVCQLGRRTDWTPNGIALAEGRVPALDTPIVAQFPEYADLGRDPERERITIRHALTMTLAMEWNENAPYTDPANSEIAMEQAPDRYRFILDRPILAKPGRGWIYSGGAVALVGKIIEREGPAGVCRTSRKRCCLIPSALTPWNGFGAKTASRRLHRGYGCRLAHWPASGR